MAPRNRTVQSTFSLSGATEDSYSGQNAQNPATSRKISSFLPTDDGQMYRELPNPKYLTTQLSGPVAGLYEFDQNDGNGNILRFYFAAARTDFNSATLTCNFYQRVGSAWVRVTAVGTLADAPMCRKIANIFHLADGTSNFIFDGTNWLREGFVIPPTVPLSGAVFTYAAGTNGPGITVAGGGSFNAGNVGRYYWTTFADHGTSLRPATESSTSAISAVTGAGATLLVKVYPTGMVAGVTVGSNTLLCGARPGGVGGIVNRSNDASGNDPLRNWVGQAVYLDGTFIGNAIEFIFNGSGQLTQLSIDRPSAGTFVAATLVVCDPRTTHFHIYASEADGSKVGQLLAQIPITQNLTTTPFIDTSPYINDSANQFLPIFRPVRNDPAPGSKILEVHKTRLWRRRETKPNFFLYAANEEVASGNNGSPPECLPGADVRTLSDIINEVSYPDQSNKVRAIVSHGDGLYLSTEAQTIPLFGQSLDDFALSQVTAFNLGTAGRFAMESTPHGLAFISYDCKAMLYPSAQIPQNANATDLLIEIGKPLRNVLKTIDRTKLDQVVTDFYYFGIRNWWVMAFPDQNGGRQTWVFDFNTRGWFQLQRGLASVGVFEISDGEFVLIGGGTDGFVYVMDDQTGTYTDTDPLPASIWRPALIDFGNPNNAHIFRALELEFTNKAMAEDTTVNYWLDPNDVDNPGVGRTLDMRASLGANRYIGWPKGGSTCQRLLIQINVRSSTNSGAIRGAKLTADTLPGIINRV